MTLQEGDRVTLDGEPGTIGAGFWDDREFVMEIKLDRGPTKAVPSGSTRVIPMQEKLTAPS